MRLWLALITCLLFSGNAMSQGFELLDRQDTYVTGLGQTLRIPLHIKNNSDRPQFYIIRRTQGDFGSTQKGYFCLDKNCLEPGMDEFSKRVDPGQTLEDLVFVLETGLVTGQNNLRFEVFVKGSYRDVIDHPVTVVVDEKPARNVVFHSNDITIQDVYPNPVSDQAFIDYKIHNEAVKAKVLIHNILGKIMGTYELPTSDTRVKLQADEFPPGVYFYTLYVENEGLITRKLIVRR